MMTRDEIKAMIEMYIEAEKAVLTGKEYRIGSRELRRENLNDIRRGRLEWERKLKALESGGRTRKIVRVIPTDL